MLGIEIPVSCELHAKIAFADTLGAMPREAPMLIWTDPVRVAWTDEESRALATSRPDLLEEIPPAVHGRPDGSGDSPIVLLLWTYHLDPVEPVFPLTFDPAYTELCIRGMARMVPAFARYAERLPRAVVDGGYYTRTRENRFLAGPLPVEGAYVCGALGGHGLMASSVAGELVASHVTGRPLPPYAPAFTLARYDDPAYRALLERWGETGQL